MRAATNPWFLGLGFGGILLTAAVTACTVGQGVEANATGGGNESSSSPTDPTSETTDGGAAATGSCLPADVKALMTSQCATSGCHTSASDPKKPPLRTFADLTAASTVDSSQTVAERSVARMKSASKPMPPDALLPAAQVSVLESWVNGGMKPVACAPGADGGPGGEGADGGGSEPDEFAVPPTCTNGPGTTSRGSSMDPGRACNQCHSFGVAGTVYPTAHEQNDCKGSNGSSAGLKLVITDASGKSYQVSVNSAGNFYANGSFSKPAKVKIVDSAGKERAMKTAITTTAMGNCNSCHTQNGTGSPAAPGRILAPK